MECRAGTILSVYFLGADGGTVQIFSFLWLCCSGYGRNGEGVVRVSFHFLQSAVSTFGCRISVVGFLCYISIFFGRFVVFFSRFSYFSKLVIFFNSLQVVQAESELGGPGTSA